MPNLVLRVSFALAIVGAAIGMTAAASETVARCDAAIGEPAADGTMVCAAPPASSVASAGRVAAAPADAVPVAAASTEQATMLVGFATALVFFAVFAILFSYRQRPGGVRTSHR